MTTAVKPLAELYEVSNTVAIFGFFVFDIFQIPVAVAQNLYTIMIYRFVGCLFGSATLAIGGGALADLWAPVDRRVAVCFLFASTFGGHVVDPIIGGFVTQSFLGWRWTHEYMFRALGPVPASRNCGTGSVMFPGEEDSA